MSRLLCVSALLAGLSLALTAPSPSAAPVPEKFTAPKPHPVVTALLQQVTLTALDDPKTTLEEGLAQLQKAAPGLTFEFNERAFKQDGVNSPAETGVTEGRPLPARKTTARRALLGLLQRLPAGSGATFLVREDHVEITTRAAQEAEIATDREAVPAPPFPALPPPAFGPAPAAMPGAGGPAPAPAGGLLGGLGALGGAGGAQLGNFGFGGQLGGFGGGSPLDDDGRRINVALVSVSLDRQPLEEAFRQVRLQAPINVVLDSAAREKGRECQTVTLLNTPVDTALATLTELADLETVWADNVFFVTTPEKAKKLRAKWPARRAGGGVPPKEGAAAGM